MVSRSLTPITAQEYELIEAAVMETARGRWFLSEFARRNRTADTGVLLDAIGRLESAVASDRSTAGFERVRVDLAEMARAIARTKSEIAAIQAPDEDGSRLVEASYALDGIVRTTERATSDILGAAEHVQEVAWTLREAGESHDACDELDRRATEIYTACSFQDLTAQRTMRIVDTLRYLEARIVAMMEIWGDAGDEPTPAPSRPAPAATDLTQSDVDLVIAVAPAPPGEREVHKGLIQERSVQERLVHERLVPAYGPAARHGPVTLTDDIVFLSDAEECVAPPARNEPVPLGQPARPVGLAQAFGDIDALSVQDRLLRFT